MAERRVVRAPMTDALFLLENQERRWIPDALTMQHLGVGWDAIEDIDAEELARYEDGGTVPTVIPPRHVDDGSIVVVGDETFLMEQGALRPVKSEAAAVGLAQPDRPVSFLSVEEARSLPVGEVFAAPAENIDTGLVYTFLGSGHQMWTRAILDRGTNRLQAQTRTRCYTWFGGFTGGVQITANEANGMIAWTSPARRFGVDGTMIGRSDRTDAWLEQIPPEIVAKTASLTIFHFWSPDWMKNLDQWLKVGIQVAEAVKVLLGLFGVKVGSGGS